MQKLTYKDIRNLPVHVLRCIQSMRGRNKSAKRIMFDCVPVASTLVLMILLYMCASLMFEDKLDSRYLPVLLIISILLVVCIKLFSRQCIIACGEYSDTEFSSCKLYCFESGIDKLLQVLPLKDAKLIYYPRVREFVEIDDATLGSMIEQHLTAVAQMEHTVYVAEYVNNITERTVYHIVDPMLAVSLAVDFDEESDSFILLQLDEE